MLLLAAALRLWKIDSPVGGFHAFHEAHDTLMAEDLLAGGSRLPPPANDGHSLLFETPPLFPHVLEAVSRVTGVSVVAGRLVSVAASLALVLAVFSLGRRLFSAPTALAAAVFVAVAPVSVLLGRNIQPDTVGLSLLVAAFFFWGKAEAGSAGSRLVAGGLAGLALVTSLLAAVGLAALFAWEIVTKRGFGFLRDGWRWTAALIALAPAALYYGYGAMRDFASVRRDAAAAAAAAALPADVASWAALGTETLWAFSPLVAFLLAAGAIGVLFKPSHERLFALLPFAFFIVFFLFFHEHGDALLWMLPWSALLAGRVLAGVPSRFLRGAVLVLTAASGALLSAVDVCSMKLGFSEFASFGRTAARLPGGEHRYLVDAEMSKGYGAVVKFYDRKARLLTGEDAARAAEEERYILAFVPPEARTPAGGWLFERERYGLELFGFSAADERADPRFFRRVRIHFGRTGGPLDFGLKELQRFPALALTPLGGASKR